MNFDTIFSVYYKEKDFMHDLQHIKRIIRKFEVIAKLEPFDQDLLILATYFHGLKDLPDTLKSDLLGIGIGKDRIQLAFDTSQWAKKGLAKNNEACILHDAHLLEGEETYLVVKSLLTGTLRGQNLLETLSYVEKTISKSKILIEENQEELDAKLLQARKIYHDLLTTIT